MANVLLHFGHLMYFACDGFIVYLLDLLIAMTSVFISKSLREHHQKTFPTLLDAVSLQNVLSLFC